MPLRRRGHPGHSGGEEVLFGGGGASWRCLSLCRQLAQTGEKTAQTSDIVIMMKNQPIVVSTTPNEPNAFPFAFTVAGKKKGVAALAPPRTSVASSAPGSRARRPMLR